MVYGQVKRSDGFRSLAANLDVVGHEMFHAADRQRKIAAISAAFDAVGIV